MGMLDSHYSWVVLLVLSLLYLLENFDRYLIAVAIIPYIDYSSYEYSLLVGPAFTTIYALGGLFFTLGHNGKDDSNQRHIPRSTFAILFTSTLVFSVVFGLTIFCTNFWQQVLVRVVMGLAQSVITPFSASIIRMLFPPDQCGSAFAIFNTGTYLAFSLSLSLGLYLYDTLGWKAGYLFSGLIGVAISFLIPLTACWSDRLAASGQLENKRGLDVNHEQEVSYNPIVEQDSDNTRQSGTVGSGSTGANSSATQRMVPLSTSNMSPIPLSASHHSLLSSVHGPEFDDEGGDGRIQPIDADDHTQQPLVSRLQQAKHRLHRILVEHWWQQPSILVLCLATGVRLGAGYIWSSYTGLFFSDLFVTQEDSIHCHYSFNATMATAASGMCSSADYPYCVSGSCSAVEQYPWHNEGMESLKVEEYMSWVPLVGSALGNLLGGFVSDRVVRGDLFRGSSHSAADTTTAERTPLRALISGLSTLLSLPVVLTSFYLPFPSCFLIYIASGILGEVYLTQTLALITEKQFIPPDLITASVALFVLLTTAIAGNATLLVPLLEAWSSSKQVDISFSASTADPTVPSSSVTFTVRQTTALQLQESLVFAMLLCYGLSGFLYLISFYMMRRRQAHCPTISTDRK